MSSTAVDFTVLSVVERSRLAECERVIERGITVFVEVGQALTEIRDGKLYRETHGTFEAYCRERWQISRPRAYEIMNQAMVSIELHEAAGLSDASDMSDVSTRDARAIKPHLALVTEEIRERVEAGEEPEAAVQAVVKEHRERRREERQTKEDAAPEAPPEIEPDEAGFDMVKEYEALAEELERINGVLRSMEATDHGREITRLHEVIAGQSTRIATLTTQYNEAAKQATRQGKLLREIRAILGVERDRDILPQLRELV